MLLSLILAKQVVNPKRATPKRSIEVEKENNLWFDFDKVKKEELHIKSYDGYDLFGYFVPAKEKSNKYVIISHGHTWTLSGSVKYYEIFKNLGYNAILYDDRGHGHNKKTTISMGLRGSKDLIEIIKYTRKRFGDDIYLGLQGESMGSGLEILALKYKPKVDFVINDCGYGNFSHVLRDQLKKMHLPKFLMYTTNFVSKTFYKIDLTSVNPIEALKDNYIPICFMHGRDDKLISYKESENMFNETKGYKEIHIFEKSDHAMSLRNNSEEYTSIVSNFLKTISL